MNDKRHIETIIDTPYRLAAKGSNGCSNSYHGVRIHALPGLHEWIAEQFVHILPHGSSLIDLAAGAGALSLRLRDLGYTVSSCDYVTENFRPEDIPFTKINLNEKFSGAIDQTYDAIVAIEILEHLENPRNLFREAWKLLRPGGHLFLSTPNIDNPVSKAYFARLGYFQWFSNNDYESEGHITPVSFRQLQWIIIETGFKIVLVDSYGNPWDRVQNWRSMRLLAKLLAWLMPDEIPQDEILLLIVQKPVNNLSQTDELHS